MPEVVDETTDWNAFVVRRMQEWQTVSEWSERDYVTWLELFSDRPHPHYGVDVFISGMRDLDLLM